MKSVRFWTPSWTDAVDWTIGYTTWYAGWVTKELMRRPHGFQPETWPIHQNSTSYSTSDIWTSWAPENSKKESLITCCITARQAPTRFPAFFLFFYASMFFSFPFFMLQCFSPFCSSCFNVCFLFSLLFTFFSQSCFQSLFSFPIQMLSLTIFLSVFYLHLL